jgi:hypothetical protein
MHIVMMIQHAMIMWLMWLQRTMRKDHSAQTITLLHAPHLDEGGAPGAQHGEGCAGGGGRSGRVQLSTQAPLRPVHAH